MKLTCCLETPYGNIYKHDLLLFFFFKAAWHSGTLTQHLKNETLAWFMSLSRWFRYSISLNMLLAGTRRLHKSLYLLFVGINISKLSPPNHTHRHAVKRVETTWKSCISTKRRKTGHIYTERIYSGALAASEALRLKAFTKHIWRRVLNKRATKRMTQELTRKAFWGFRVGVEPTGEQAQVVGAVM